MHILIIKDRNFDISQLVALFEKVGVHFPRYTIIRRGVEQMPVSLDAYDCVFLCGSAAVMLSKDCSSWMDAQQRLIQMIITCAIPCFGSCWGGVHIAQQLGVPTTCFNHFTFTAETVQVRHPYGCMAGIDSYTSIISGGIMFVQYDRRLLVHSVLKNGMVDIFSYKDHIMGCKTAFGISPEARLNTIRAIDPPKHESLSHFIAQVDATKQKKVAEEVLILSGFLKQNGLLSDSF